MANLNLIAALALSCCFASTMAGPDPQPLLANLNLAYPYSTTFHEAFALIAFTTVVISATLFGLSLAMWNMDPGRDSIIYRMTSQRMKKDQ